MIETGIIIKEIIAVPWQQVARILCQERTLVNGLPLTIVLKRNGKCYRNSYGRIIATKTCQRNNFNCIGLYEKSLISTKSFIAEWWSLRIHRA